MVVAAMTIGGIPIKGTGVETGPALDGLFAATLSWGDALPSIGAFGVKVVESALASTL